MEVENIKYRLYDSSIRTAKENLLFTAKYNDRILLDLSLLEDLNITTSERVAIIRYCVESVYTVAIKHWSFNLEDSYTKISGYLFYNSIAVISSNGDYAYTIMRLRVVGGTKYKDHKTPEVFELQNKDLKDPDFIRVKG